MTGPAYERSNQPPELIAVAKACPDCRAVERAHQLAARHIPTHKILTQGDPRGCVLWLYPGNSSAEDIDNGRARSYALAVPGRY